MLSKAKYKTRLTQNESKNTQVMQTHLGNTQVMQTHLFLPHLGRTFPLIKPLNQQ